MKALNIQNHCIFLAALLHCHSIVWQYNNANIRIHVLLFYFAHLDDSNSVIHPTDRKLSSFIHSTHAVLTFCPSSPWRPCQCQGHSQTLGWKAMCGGHTSTPGPVLAVWGHTCWTIAVYGKIYQNKIILLKIYYNTNASNVM